MQVITTREQLLNFKRKYGLRDDWHEPDNQGVTAEVRGTPGSFDNAMTPGDWYRPSVNDLRAELHVVLRRDVQEPTPDDDLAVVNLATLFAWATGHEPLTAAERVQERLAKLDPEGAWRRRLAQDVRDHAVRVTDAARAQGVVGEVVAAMIERIYDEVADRIAQDAL